MDDGTWIPFPVEYKRGKPKMDDCDKVQLCASLFTPSVGLSASVSFLTENGSFLAKVQGRGKM
jgi:hypothetical protein